MPDYRIGSFTRPSERIGAKPIIIYFAKLPRGGDISGDAGTVIAAIEFDLQQLDIQIDSAKIVLWLEHFAAMSRLYDFTRIDFDDDDFVYAQISNDFVHAELIAFDSEDEFVTALNLPSTGYGGG